jgi:hypothetical protein
MIFPLLAGIVIAAAVFAALLWSIYRAVQTNGKARAVYVILAISTLLVVTAFTYDLLGLLLTSGFTCIGAALYAMVLDRGWNKLLPFVQLLLGGLAAWSSVIAAMP